MISGTVFFWVLPLTFAVFAAVFVAIARSQAGVASARWGALAFGVGALAIVLDTVRAPMPPMTFTFAVPLHWLSIVCLLNAFLSRHALLIPRRPAIAIFAVGLGVNLWFSFVDPQVSVRVLLVNIVACALVCISMPGLVRHARIMLDRITCWLMAISALSYVVRSILYVSMHQSGEYGARSIWSQYMLTAYVCVSVLALMIAVQLVLTITKDLIDRQHREATSDPLTGVGNRRQLYDIVEAHDNGGARIGAAMMIDLDHFKAINDRAGHDAGDQVLVAVAAVLRSHAASFGHIVRMGGEEFALLVHATHAEAALPVAELLRIAIANVPVAAAQVSDGAAAVARVTASFGVAVVAPGEPLAAAMRRADVALYAAKDRGRNRVVLAAASADSAAGVHPALIRRVRP